MAVHHSVALYGRCSAKSSFSCLIWQVLRQVERGGGFRVLGTKTFPMTFSASSLQSQARTSPRSAPTGHSMRGCPSMDGSRSCLDGYTHCLLTHSLTHPLTHSLTHCTFLIWQLTPSQLKFAREEASHITDPALRAALDAAAKRLHARTESDLGSDRLVTPPNARNYAIVLERLRDPS